MRGGSPRHDGGWTNTVYKVVGAAGKVLNFCWNSAFRGFHAGGGRGYDMGAGTPIVVENGRAWLQLGEKEDVFNDHYSSNFCQDSAVLPGEFPGETLIDDYMSQPESYQRRSTHTPVQRDSGTTGGSVNNHWVMVRPEDVDSRDASPTRHARKVPSTNTYRQAKPISRAATDTRPRLAPAKPSQTGSFHLSSHHSASYASPRASNLQHSPGQRPQPATSPRHSRSRSSIAPSRRPDSAHAGFPTPTTSPEVRKFDNKIRRQERLEEKNLQKVNQQLQDMIWQGKQALSTRIDVVDDDELTDEG